MSPSALMFLQSFDTDCGWPTAGFRSGEQELPAPLQADSAQPSGSEPSLVSDVPPTPITVRRFCGQVPAVPTYPLSPVDTVMVVPFWSSAPAILPPSSVESAGKP